MKLRTSILLIAFQVFVGMSLFATQPQFQQLNDCTQVSSAQPCQTVVDPISKVETRTCTMQAEGCKIEFLTMTTQSWENKSIVIQMTQTAERCVAGGEATVGILYHGSDEPQTFRSQQSFNCQGKLIISVKDFISNNQKVLTHQPIQLIQVEQRGRKWQIKLNEAESAQFLRYMN